MLGVKLTKQRICREDSKLVIESLSRSMSGKLTEEEVQIDKKFEEAGRQYSFVWK